MKRNEFSLQWVLYVPDCMATQQKLFPYSGCQALLLLRSTSLPWLRQTKGILQKATEGTQTHPAPICTNVISHHLPSLKVTKHITQRPIKTILHYNNLAKACRKKASSRNWAQTEEQSNYFAWPELKIICLSYRKPELQSKYWYCINSQLDDFHRVSSGDESNVKI